MIRFALLAVAVVLWSALAHADNEIVGTWEAKDEGATIVLELRADGKGMMDGDAITWRLQGTRLEVVIDGETIQYAFRLDGDALEVSGGDLDQPMRFARKGGPKKGLGARRKGLVGPLGGQEGTEKPPVDPKPPLAGLPGEWETKGATGLVTLTLKGDGTGSIGTTAFTYTFTDKTLTLSANGESLTYTYELKGDVLVAQGGDLAGPTEFRRKAAAVRAPTTGLTGTWRSAQETVEFRGDGTVVANGRSLRYGVKDQTLTIEGPTGPVVFELAQQGDTLTLARDGQKDTYTRVTAGSSGPAEGPAAALAGVWMVQEATLDPAHYMSYTQYVTLYPDGSVAYQKAEGGATRQAVTEHLERFTSWRNTPGATAGNAGTWQSDGTTITIRWRLWNGLVSQGPVDLAGGKLSLSGMGVLEEGKTLTFERQK